MIKGNNVEESRQGVPEIFEQAQLERMPLYEFDALISS